MRPNIEEIRERVKDVPYDNQRWGETKHLIDYIDELENMPLVQTVVKLQEENEGLRNVLREIVSDCEDQLGQALEGDTK